MKTLFSHVILGPVLIFLLFAQPGLTQPSDELKSLKKEIENLKEGQKAIPLLPSSPQKGGVTMLKHWLIRQARAS